MIHALLLFHHYGRTPPQGRGAARGGRPSSSWRLRAERRLRQSVHSVKGRHPPGNHQVRHRASSGQTTTCSVARGRGGFRTSGGGSVRSLLLLQQSRPRAGESANARRHHPSLLPLLMPVAAPRQSQPDTPASSLPRPVGREAASRRRGIAAAMRAARQDAAHVADVPPSQSCGAWTTGSATVPPQSVLERPRTAHFSLQDRHSHSWTQCAACRCWPCAPARQAVTAPPLVAVRAPRRRQALARPCTQAPSRCVPASPAALRRRPSCAV
jgi:hypothetical protein